MSLQIDFAPVARRQSPLRLAIGSAMLALIIGAAWSLTGEMEVGLPANYVSMPAEEEIQGINSAIDDLNFPWLAVLTSIESSADETLRILQLDADARDGRLSMQGDARDSRVALELPGRLRRNPAIADARLVSQSPASDGETHEFPIRFALEMTFGVPEEEQP